MKELFAQPGILAHLVWILPGFLLLFMLYRTLAKRRVAAFAHEKMHSHLLKNTSSWRRRSKFALPAFALILSLE